MRKIVCHTFLIASILLNGYCFSQDSSLTSSQTAKYLDAVAHKSERLEKRLDKTSKKALARLKRQDIRIQRKLARYDSANAVVVSGTTRRQYRELEEQLDQPQQHSRYMPSLDTMLTSLAFLQHNPLQGSSQPDIAHQLQGTLDKAEALKGRFQQAEVVEKFLRERKQLLKEQLQKYGFNRELKKLNKQYYYFSGQVSEYRAMLNDHKNAERKAIELLSKTKVFKDFMRKYGQLASLFRFPGDPGNPASSASLAGLQTRVQVNALLQRQLAAGGAGAQQQLQQNVRAAQSELANLKSKVSDLGNGREVEIPDGFKLNSQKTKTFLQRIETGINIQSKKSNGYLPVTSDFGLSIGYKLNDKSVVGVGASYKMGWGKDIRHIVVTNEGAGLRSFIDWRVKGSFWLSGGFEMNYNLAFRRFEQLRQMDAWQASGLAGLSKTVSLKGKVFRRTKLQLLWDFMSYRQQPRTQPVLFRVGYSFK